MTTTKTIGAEERIMLEDTFLPILDVATKVYDKKEDGQLVFHFDALKVLIGNTKDEIVVAFRGTKWGVKTDMLINTFAFPWGDYHYGFSKELSAHWRDLREVIVGIQRVEQKPIVFTGHSQGGAQAQLAYVWFSERYPRLETACVTFGSPATFTRHGAEKHKGWTDRILNLERDDDPVTLVPWMLGTFVDVGAMSVFDSKKKEWIYGGDKPGTFTRIWRSLTGPRHNTKAYAEALLSEVPGG